MTSVLSRQYSVYIYIAVILITLLSFPVKIECCSLNTYEIISLMSQNPNYQNDPCYLQWQAEQNEKLTQLWAQRDKLEESIRESNRKQMEYNAKLWAERERDAQQRANKMSTSTQTATGTGFEKSIGYLALMGVILVILCCAACAVMSDDENNATTNTPTTNVHQNEVSLNQLTPIATSNVLGNQTTSTTNENNSNSRQESGSRVELMPRRQNSLPSYEDAVKMPSAPPIE